MNVLQVQDTFRVNCFTCCTASRDMVASPCSRERGRVRVSPGIWCRRNSNPSPQSSPLAKGRGRAHYPNCREIANAFENKLLSL
jgi:hypothetical protein